MLNIIILICNILNMCKDFHANYTFDSADKGCMYIKYRDQGYAVKLVPMTMKEDETDMNRVRKLRDFFN